ncbi:hypothetical protein BRD17_08920 [Halobacteriales archaeon SW_7_68_16]|nr:MAG: hypothetical protein BRD17_08920 [Halobacteriales archaeon SW_7_68_16]
MSDGQTEAATATEAGDGDSYGGVVGAFPYAFRTSGSRLFRSYAAVGGLLAAVVVALFVLALVTMVGRTASATGGTFTFSRAFLLVVMVLVVVPLIAPVLLVARRHRRTASTVAYDRALAAAGYLFVVALYVGLVISAPPSLTDGPGSGPVGALVAWLYSLPQVAGAVPPLSAAAYVYLAHRRFR